MTVAVRPVLPASFARSVRPSALGRIVPALLVAAAALVAVGGVVAAGSVVLATIASLLPIDALDQADPVVAVAAAVALLALAVGLVRGKRLAWWLAVTVFGSAAIVQATILGHPVGAAAAAVCLLVLAWDRRHYQIGTERAWVRRVPLLVGFAAAAVAAETVLSIVITGAWAQPVTDLTQVAGTVVTWLSFSDPDAVTNIAGHGAVFALLLLVTRLPVALVALGILQPVPEPPPDTLLRARARAILAEHGTGALLPFQLGDDKLVCELPGSRAMVVYGRAGRSAIALGDPIGPADDAWRAFGAFAETCRARDQVPAVYQASQAAPGPLGTLGFRIFRIGAEAIIDLDGFSLAGSRRANLRHTVTRFKRDGATVRWFPNGIHCEGATPIRRTLVEIDDAWRAAAGPELGFTINRFDAAELDRIAIAVAFESDGTPTAFATFRPTGADGGWVLDLLRRRSGGTPGAMEACLAEAAAGLRDGGAPTLSLGLAPLAGFDGRSGPFEERLLGTAARLLKRWYDVAGLAFFKNKFDPRWEPRYAAVTGRAQLFWMSVALLRLHLGGPGGSLRGSVAAVVAAARPRG